MLFIIFVRACVLLCIHLAERHHDTLCVALQYTLLIKTYFRIIDLSLLSSSRIKNHETGQEHKSQIRTKLRELFKNWVYLFVE